MKKIIFAIFTCCVLLAALPTMAAKSVTWTDTRLINIQINLQEVRTCLTDSDNDGVKDADCTVKIKPTISAMGKVTASDGTEKIVTLVGTWEQLPQAIRTNLKIFHAWASQKFNNAYIDLNEENLPDYDE